MSAGLSSGPSPREGVFAHWPNRITAVRFVGALVLFALLEQVSELQPDDFDGERLVPLISFWLFVIVAGTDFLDGYLARKGNIVTAFGRIADPFVDKVLVLGTMIFLTVTPWASMYLPAWIVVVILAREFLVTGLRGYVESLGGEFPADKFGKIKMVVQCIAVGGLIWLRAYDWSVGWYAFWEKVVVSAVWLTLITTMGSGLSYAFKTQRFLASKGEGEEGEGR